MTAGLWIVLALMVPLLSFTDLLDIRPGQPPLAIAAMAIMVIGAMVIMVATLDAVLDGALALIRRWWGRSRRSAPMAAGEWRRFASRLARPWSSRPAT
jgi:hypothetical protein